jgi:hypothetical protein
MLSSNCLFDFDTGVPVLRDRAALTVWLFASGVAKASRTAITFTGGGCFDYMGSGVLLVLTKGF